MVRFSKPDIAIPRGVDTEGYLYLMDEQQSGQRVDTEVNRRNRGYLDGQEIRVWEKPKVDEGEAARHASAKMNARGQEHKFASLAVMKIP